MRAPCMEVAPLLHRVADGEASPHEAMLTARHVSDCTACRITLAREVRLAAMLEERLEDPLPVGEDFVRSVMDNLPLGPPKPPRSKRERRRALKLACLAGLLGLLPWASATPDAAMAATGGGFRLPGILELPVVDGLSDTAFRFGGLLLLVVERLGAALPVAADLRLPVLAVGSTLALVALLAALTTASVFAVAMRGLLQTRSSGSV